MPMPRGMLIPMGMGMGMGIPTPTPIPPDDDDDDEFGFDVEIELGFESEFLTPRDLDTTREYKSISCFSVVITSLSLAFSCFTDVYSFSSCV